MAETKTFRSVVTFGADPDAQTVQPTDIDAETVIKIVSISMIDVGAVAAPEFSVSVVPREKVTDAEASADLLTDVQPVANAVGRRVAYVGSENIEFNPRYDILRVGARGYNGKRAYVVTRLRFLDRPNTDLGGFAPVIGLNDLHPLHGTPVDQE